MPVRATKRGAERTPLSGTWDVLICGASFAGLAVARELAGAGARVMVVDRYEIGERQTSACCAPTEWLERLGLAPAIRQTFDSIVMHTPRHSVRWPQPYTWSTFDYRHLCELMWQQCDADFETAKVHRREGRTIVTDRGELTAPVLVDCLGWRRMLAADGGFQPPNGPLSRGLEAHPGGTGPDLELWLDPKYVPAGYGWSFPAGDELRIGIGGYDPRVPVKEATLRIIGDCGKAPNEYQGNWIPHRLRRGVEDGVFFAGDSAGHCIPLTAEGIRTAWYFGSAVGREIRHVLGGRQDITTALRRYDEFNEAHRWMYTLMYLGQQSIKHLHGPLLDLAVRAHGRRALAHRNFSGYLRLAPPAAATPPRLWRDHAAAVAA